MSLIGRQFKQAFMVIIEMNEKLDVKIKKQTKKTCIFRDINRTIR